MRDIEWSDVKECPLCGGTDRRLRQRVTQQLADKEVTIHFFACKCGMVFMDPRPSDDFIKYYYSSGAYRELTTGTDETRRSNLGLEIMRAHHQADWLGWMLKDRKVQRHLDIGSSTGALLQVLSFRLGCESIGVEADPSYRKFATGKSLKVVESIDQAKPPFDLITLSHVLEHQPDPVAFLRDISLAATEPPCGPYVPHVMVEVPSVFGPHALRFHHPVAFSEHTLIETAAKAGLVLAAGVLRHGMPNGIPDLNLLALFVRSA